ncbi:MAG: MBL fold metallo-hydrolase [Clostridia bacterium]|nr:MBL fold metallo-hydrolase [Clostridia bacterium]
MIKFCSLFSGSSGNSLFLGFESTRILIDAGLSAKKITQALCSIGENPSELSAILISHEHSDHIKGAGILSRRFNLPVYANTSTWQSMESFIGPVQAHNKQYFVSGEDFKIGSIAVRPFSIPHDASDPVGFNFFINGRKITTATDIGHINREILGYLEKSDMILLESNHDVEMLRVGPYPWHLKRRILGDRGHLSNDMAGKVVAYLASLGTRHFLLGHLSKENNFPELAYETVSNTLFEKKLAIGSDIYIDVALRDRVSRVVEL